MSEVELKVSIERFDKDLGGLGSEVGSRKSEVGGLGSEVGGRKAEGGRRRSEVGGE